MMFRHKKDLPRKFWKFIRWQVKIRYSIKPISDGFHKKSAAVKNRKFLEQYDEARPRTDYVVVPVLCIPFSEIRTLDMRYPVVMELWM